MHLREPRWNRRNCYRGFIFVCISERRVDATLDHFVVHKSRKSSRWALSANQRLCMYTKWPGRRGLIRVHVSRQSQSNPPGWVVSLVDELSEYRVKVTQHYGQTFGTTLADSWWRDKDDTSFERAPRRGVHLCRLYPQLKVAATRNSFTDSLVERLSAS